METIRKKQSYTKKENLPKNDDDKGLTNVDFGRISATMATKLKVDYPPSGLVTFVEVEIE